MLQHLDFPDAQLYLQGSHLTRFKDWLFLSSRSHFEPGHAIRGGIPVVFPWFGLKHDEPRAPQHGWARTALWTVEEQSERGATLSISREEWQVRFVFEFGEVLRARAAVQNGAAFARAFEFVLHSYFAVADLSNVQAEGLDGRAFSDKTDGGALKVQRGPIEFGGEVDWVFEDASAPLVLRDGASGFALSGDFVSAVVWNPGEAKARTLGDLGEGEWRKFVCVEVGALGANAVELEAGARWTMDVAIERR